MSVSASSLSLFWELASQSEDKRIHSSSNLVSGLVAQQAAIVATTSRTTLDQIDGRDRQDHHVVASSFGACIDSKLAADVGYSLCRLIRGLASPREQSRLGFAVALTELLSRLVTVLHPAEVLALVKKHCVASGKVSRSEERNLLFARLFGIQAILRSGLLLSHPQAGLREAREAIKILIELSKAKAWLAESAGWVLSELLDEALSRCSSLELRDGVVEVLAQYVTNGVLTPEKVALLLKLPPIHVDNRHHPALSKGDVLSQRNLTVAAKVLSNASVIALDQEDAKKTAKESKDSSGAHNPKAHFVWESILESYFGPGRSSPESRAPFADFYRVAVDDSLFAAQASPERKFWGFQVFCKALPVLPAIEKPFLFTPNFMRTWINQLSGKDRLLHNAAAHTAAVIQATVKENPQAGFSLLSQLLGKHGSQNFDRLTNTKTVEGLLASMNADGVREYVSWTVQVIAESTEVVKRRWGFDQLLLLIRNAALPTDDECIEEILRYLTAGAFFIWTKAFKHGLLSYQPNPAFDDETRILLRSRLLSCLTELTERTTAVNSTSASTGEVKSRKVQGVNSMGEAWVVKAWRILWSFSDNTKEFSSTVPAEVQTGLQRASQLLKRVEALAQGEKNTSKSERICAFEHLIIASMLYAHDSYEKNVDELLEQLQDCFDRLFSTNKDGRGDDGKDITGIELLLDYLVGILERPSAFLRAIAQQVFGVFAVDMNAPSLDHLVDQLGLNEEPEDASDEDEEAKRDDEEFSQASSDSASSAEQDGDKDEHVEVDTELRDRVFAVLKAGGMADTEEEDASGDDGDNDREGSSDAGVFHGTAAVDGSDVESLPDLIDEQMLQIDDQLVEIFRSRLGGRKNDKGAKQELVAFRNKILDLLAIYAKKCPSSPLVVRLVRPLFVLAIESDKDDRQTSNKAGNILRNQICKAKYVPQGADVESAVEDLEAVHNFARSTSSSELAALANISNVYLSRVCFFESSLVYAKVVALYEKTLADFLTRNASQLKGQFLVDAFRRLPLLGWEVRSKLFEGCSLTATMKAFRQQQAMQMLQMVLIQLAQSKSSSDEARLSKLLPEVADAVFSSLSAVISIGFRETQGASEDVNTNKLKGILKLALQSARLTCKVNSGGVKTIWKLAKIREATDGLSERFGQSTSLQGLLRQLLAVVEGGSAESTKKDRKRKEQSFREETPSGVTDEQNGSADTASNKRQKKTKASVNGTGNGVVGGEQKKERPKSVKKAGRS